MYFITNGTPSSFWGFVGDMLEPLGYGRPRIALPAALIYFIAWVWENIIMVLVCRLMLSQVQLTYVLAWHSSVMAASQS